MEVHKYNSIPITTTQHISQEVTTLTFMDDSTLISNSIFGLEWMLDTANEFYTLNNTQANPHKYVLISNFLPDPTPITFNLLNNSFTITSIPSTQSFCFLGVWFSFSNTPSYVHSQIKKNTSNLLI